MRSSASILSPPPSPNPTPLPFSSLPSSLTSCPELDLSVTLSPAPKSGHTHMKSRPLRKCPQSDKSELKPSPKGQTERRKKSTQVCLEEPVVVAGTPGKKKPQQPVKTQQRSRKNHHAPIQRVEPPAAASNQEPNSLEKVELNTTLALKAELYTLQAAEFNSQKAIEETLQRSERTKNLINSKATDVVNVRRSQLLYTSLVSVDVQEDQLISQVMQDRLLLAPPPQCHGNKVADGPSTLLFMTPDLFRQKPLPPEEEPIKNKLHPSTHPAHSTFDLYRRRRRCEASP